MVTGYNFQKCISVKIVFVLGNSADPDEMPLYAAFHLGLHCLTCSTILGLSGHQSLMGSSKSHGASREHSGSVVESLTRD